MKFLLFCVVVLFSVLGLSEFLHFLKLLFIFPKRKMHSTLVVMLNDKTAVSQIIFAGEQLKWLGNKYADRVIVVCENLNGETLEECKELATKYNLKFVVKGNG